MSSLGLIIEEGVFLIEKMERQLSYSPSPQPSHCAWIQIGPLRLFLQLTYSSGDLPMDAQWHILLGFKQCKLQVK